MINTEFKNNSLSVSTQRLLKKNKNEYICQFSKLLYRMPFLFKKFKEKFYSTLPIPKVVYMTGMPRCGTSVAKNYLGNYPGLKVIKYHEKGFQFPWIAANKDDEIVIDKGATKYICGAYRKIYLEYGNSISFYCLVRDPRDEMASLLESDIHAEIYRDHRFWKQWTNMYNAYLKFSSYLNNPSRWYLIRYEDLVRWPVQAKMEFVKWVGLNVYTNRITDKYDVMHKNDQQDWKLKKHNTIKAHSIGRWLKTTDCETADLYHQWLQLEGTIELMHRLGYTENGVSDSPLNFDGLTVFQPQVF